MARKIAKGAHPLAEVEKGLTKGYQRKSTDLIYESVMRGGGAPFGAPFNFGTQSLTEKIVALFKQRGFFGFETMERLRQPNRRNKFTLHGASRFRGEYRSKRRSGS